MIPSSLKQFINDIEESGIRIKPNCNGVSIEKTKNKEFLITYNESYPDIVLEKKVMSKFLVLALGRDMQKPLHINKLLKNVSVNFEPKNLEIGCRIEVRSQILDEIVDITFDPKFKVITPTYDDDVREIFKDNLESDLSRSTVLDVGCGGGLFTEELARLGCRVAGVDLSRRSIEVAQQHAEQKGLTIMYHVASGDQLPFYDNTFDLVVCCDVIEHVNDVSLVISESARVLKSGGM